MYWDRNRILERIFYWKDYLEYGGDKKLASKWVEIPKRRRSKFQADFITEAENNVMFNRAFYHLTALEKQILIELYLIRGEDMGGMIDGKGVNAAVIEVSDENWAEVARIFRMTSWELGNAVKIALDKMLDYLNYQDNREIARARLGV